MPAQKQIAALSLFLVLLGTVSADQVAIESLNQQVLRTEQAFADSMAQRDFEAFKSFLSEEAVFFSEPGVLRGSESVADAWAVYFTDANAPFSWEPEQVEVLDSGLLAHSSGPVLNTVGRRVATYNSIWRYDQDRKKWLIVFDKGNTFCEPPKP